MSELEEKVARALAERMQINYDTMLAGERNHLHRDAQAVIPIIRKQIAQELRIKVEPWNPHNTGLSFLAAANFIEQGDEQ